MQDPFDPYQQWLGIPPSEQPPDHYRLLGIARFESNPSVIAAAIERRIAHVRACAGTGRPDALEDLLEDLATAKHLLLNPTFKQQYDSILRAHTAATFATPPPTASAVAPAAVPSPAAASVAPPTIITDSAPTAGVRARVAGGVGAADGAQTGNEQKTAAMRPVVIASLVGGLVVVAVFVLVIARSGPREKIASQENRSSAQAKSSDKPPPSPKRPPRRNPQPQPTSSSSSPSRDPGPITPLGPRTMGDLMNQDDKSPPDTRSTTGLAAAARLAMADRQMDAARHHVDAAVNMARSPTERAEVERVGKLLAALTAFWNGVREQAGKIQAGEELVVGSTRVIVVEAENDRLIIRVSGNNRVYHVIDGLPRQIAVALAQRQIGNRSPIANLRIGAFLAVDAHGDRQEARRRLEAAGPDGRALLPELELAGPVKATDGRGDTPDPVMHAADEPGSSPAEKPGAPALGGGKLPVPDNDLLEAAGEQVREVFKGEFAGARSNKDGKVALAKKMYTMAEETQDNPAARYFAYQVACDIAIELGDPESFFWAVGRMDHYFRIDPVAMKAEGLAKAWRDQTDATARRQIYEYSKRLAEEAIRAKHYRAADRALRIAITGAKAEKNFALLRQLEEKAKEVEKNVR